MATENPRNGIITVEKSETVSIYDTMFIVQPNTVTQDLFLRECGMTVVDNRTNVCYRTDSSKCIIVPESSSLSALSDDSSSLNSCSKESYSVKTSLS